MKPGAVVAPDERLSWSRTIGIGMQHVVAMFGATLLVPTLTGFPVNTTLLFSGLGTIIFLLITRNQLPSYLGSSFAFIAPLTASQQYGIGSQLGGVLLTGVALILVGVIVQKAGKRVIDAVMLGCVKFCGRVNPLCLVVGVRLRRRVCRRSGF